MQSFVVDFYGNEMCIIFVNSSFCCASEKCLRFIYFNRNLSSSLLSAAAAKNNVLSAKFCAIFSTAIHRVFVYKFYPSLYDKCRNIKLILIIRPALFYMWVCRWILDLKENSTPIIAYLRKKKENICA